MKSCMLIAEVSGVGSLGGAAGGVYLALSDSVSISIITSSGAVIMACVSAYFAYKAKATAAETHKVVNSRMTEFMEMAKKFYRGEGKLEEKTEEKARQALRLQGVAAEKVAELARLNQTNERQNI